MGDCGDFWHDSGFCPPRLPDLRGLLISQNYAALYPKLKISFLLHQLLERPPAIGYTKVTYVIQEHPCR